MGRSCNARIFIRQQKTDDALEWAREHGLSVEDDLSYVHEYEHITLARVLLASGSEVKHQGSWVACCRRRNMGAGRGSVIEIVVLQALAYQMRGAMRAALVPLERALELAEPEGYVRVFVDEGTPMAALLKAFARRTATDYVHRLLTALIQARPWANSSPGKTSSSR